VLRKKGEEVRRDKGRECSPSSSSEICTGRTDVCIPTCVLAFVEKTWGVVEYLHVGVDV